MEMIFIFSFISLTIIVFILLNNHFPRIDDQLDNFSEYRVIFVNFWIRSIPFKRNLFRFLILYFFLTIAYLFFCLHQRILILSEIHGMQIFFKNIRITDRFHFSNFNFSIKV